MNLISISGIYLSCHRCGLAPQVSVRLPVGGIRLALRSNNTVSMLGKSIIAEPPDPRPPSPLTPQDLTKMILSSGTQTPSTSDHRTNYW